MQDALWLAGSARGVKNEQRVLGIEGLRLVFIAGFGEGHVPVDIATLDPVHILVGSLDDQDVLHRRALVASKSFVDGWLQRAGLALSVAAVSGDDELGLSIIDATRERIGRKAAEHHRVNCADSSNRLHGNYCLGNHRQIDSDAISSLDAHLGQHVGGLFDLAG